MGRPVLRLVVSVREELMKEGIATHYQEKGEVGVEIGSGADIDRALDILKIDLKMWLKDRGYV